MNKLPKIYYDVQNPAGYSSEKKLAHEAKKYKISKQVVKDWLEGQDAYTLHKPARKNYRRSRYHLLGIGDLFQADLAVLDSLAKWNDRIKYLLVIIDCFSKFLWVLPAREKSANAILKLVQSFMSDTQIKPKNFMTDRGGEFVNAKLQNYLKNQGVNFYTAENPDTKCAFAERVIRTIKTKIFRYLTHQQNWRYIDKLSAIVDSYNHSVHRTIGMKPVNVTREDEPRLRKLLNPKIKLTEARFKVGDTVRISKQKRTFEKGYTPNWSEEIFTVAKVLKADPARYKIQDYNGELILGSFYGVELQKVHRKEIFAIEKVLQKNKNKWLVKWKGYPTSMASWVKAKDVMSINNDASTAQ